MDRIQKQELHEIFQKAIQGEVNALNGLYEKYYRLVYSIAFSILKNKEDSEDVAQNVFAKIFQINTDKLPTANEASWLYSLTKNETLNYLRTKKENVNLDEIYYLTEEDKDLNKIIAHDSYNRIIAKLNKQEREIISLKILSNMSFKEIALLLNMPIGTVQWKYYTSLYTLRILLGNISMVIIGILIFLKANLSNKRIEQNYEETEEKEENRENETEANKDEYQENEAGSTITSDNSVDSIEENIVDSNEVIDNIEGSIENEQESTYMNTNVNTIILSITGIFLVLSIIFAIIFAKHQQKSRKNVSK